MANTLPLRKAAVISEWRSIRRRRRDERAAKDLLLFQQQEKGVQ